MGVKLVMSVKLIDDGEAVFESSLDIPFDENMRLDSIERHAETWHGLMMMGLQHGVEYVAATLGSEE